MRVKHLIQSLPDGYFLLVLSLCLCLGWLLAFYPAMDYYWTGDDIHLVRVHSKEELQQTFRGDWDPDGLETPGWRPFSALFNHLRAQTLGEWLVGQRLFVLGLTGILLVLIGQIAFRLGLGRTHVAMALLIVMATRTLARDIIWITTGGHLFQWILFALATLLVLSYCDRAAIWKLLLSLICGWIALWTREDSLVILLLIPILHLSYIATRSSVCRPRHELRRTIADKSVLVYYFCLLALAIGTLAYRGQVVTNAIVLRSVRDSIVGPISHIRWTILLVGDFVPWSPGRHSGRFLMELATLTWTGLLGMSAAVFWLFSRPLALGRTAIGLLCMLVACLPSLTMARADLLLLPTIFFSFVIAVILVETWEIVSLRSSASSELQGRSLPTRPVDPGVPSTRRRSEFALVRALCIGVAMLAVGGSLYRAKLQVLDMHPMSINQLSRDISLIFKLESVATIPSARINFLKIKLGRLGIHSLEDGNRVLSQLVAAAQSGKLFAPNPENKPFIPPTDFLSP